MTVRGGGVVVDQVSLQRRLSKCWVFLPYLVLDSGRIDLRFKVGFLKLGLLIVMASQFSSRLRSDFIDAEDYRLNHLVAGHRDYL